MGDGLGMTVVLLVAGGLAAAGGAGYAIGLYNSLVQVKSNVEKAWKNIDVLLQQRHDELPKLVDACKGFMKHERELLDRLTQLRAGYGQARGMDEKARIENELNRGLAGLRLSMEAYPDLKSAQNVLQLQGRISALESGIADRRELFNDSVNIYNVQIRRLPEVLLAIPLGYRPHEFLAVPEELKADVKIAL